MSTDKRLLLTTFRTELWSYIDEFRPENHRLHVVSIEEQNNDYCTECEEFIIKHFVPKHEGHRPVRILSYSTLCKICKKICMLSPCPSIVHYINRLKDIVLVEGITGDTAFHTDVALQKIWVKNGSYIAQTYASILCRLYFPDFPWDFM